MNNCKTCKWWIAHEEPRYEVGEEYNGEAKPWNPDEPMPHEFEVRFCRHPKLLFCERPLESNTFAVSDGSMYAANLHTAENFGCVLHEAGAA